MNITNDKPITIYKFEEGDKVRYTFGVGKKKQDSDEYENAFFPIQFIKGVKIENKQKIKIKKAWLSFYNWEFQGKKGNTFYIMCSEFDLIKEEPKEEQDPFASFGATVKIEENDFLD